MQLTETGGTIKDLLAMFVITLVVGVIAIALALLGFWLAFGEFGLQVAIVGAIFIFAILFVLFVAWIVERMRSNEARSFRATLATANQTHADIAGTYTDLIASDDERDAKQFQATAKMVLELLRVVKEQEKQQLERVKTDEHAARTENRYRIAEDARQRKELEASAIDGEFYGQLPQVSGLRLPEIE